MSKHEFTDDMSRITPYTDLEHVAQKMVVAGIEFLESHPDTEIMFEGQPGIIGLFTRKFWEPKTPAAEELHDKLLDVVSEADFDGDFPEDKRDEAKVVARHFALDDIGRIKTVGWDQYVIESRAVRAAALAQMAAEEAALEELPVPDQRGGE
jgi:hypothetical protein